VGLRSISSAELSEWLAYMKSNGPINPYYRQDWAMAQISAILANANRDTKKRKRPFKTDDFMPQFGRAAATKTQTSEQILRTIEQINMALGGKDLRDK
jgi:hypothetical protein